MKRIFTFILLVLGPAILISPSMSKADDTETLSKVDECLAYVQTYDYEQGGGPPTDLERIIFQLPADSPLRGEIEQKLIDAIDGSNSIGRGIICRQLRVVGTEACVPAVAPMLTDPETSHFARYALEGIGRPVALDAMLGAIGTTSGDLQVGLINSLANAGYAPILPDCTTLLGSDDQAVASASARALGRIGGSDSIATLTSAKADASGQLALDIDLALLNGAWALFSDGDADAAAEIFATLYEPNDPFELAGLRGLTLAQPDNTANLLVEAIQSDNIELAAFAINLIPSVQGEEATAKFVALINELPMEGQFLMLKALGARGDVSAAPAMIAALTGDDSALHPIALEALGGLPGNALIVETLVRTATNGVDVNQNVARASLSRISGDDVESLLIQIAQGDDIEEGVEAIRALAARNAKQESKLLLILAKDDESPIRIAAIEALGTLAGSDDVQAFAELAAAPYNLADLPAIETSLGRVIMRTEDPTYQVVHLMNASKTAAPETFPVFIRLLSKSGGQDALDGVRAALRSSNASIHSAAVESLCQWPNSLAAEGLIQLLKSDQTPEVKEAALSGYLRIAINSDDPPLMLLNVLNEVEGVNEKKQVLNEIGLSCESLEAIEMTQTLLNDPQLQASAAIATTRIAYKLRSSHRDTVRTVLEDVLVKVGHPDVQVRAQEVLNDLDKDKDHIKEWVAIGPFVDDEITSGEQSYNTVFEPEKADTSDLEWTPLTEGAGSWSYNLEATYGSIDHCSAYARTMVWSPIDQDVQVEGGCDDALRMWVNGELIFDDYNIKGGSPRTMLAPAALHEGWNELKVKAVDHEGGWQFGCRIRKPNGSKIERLVYEAR